MAEDHLRCRNEFEYRGVTMNEYTTLELLKKSENFEFRSDDVVVATFPRSGTTLTQEIIWQIVHHEEVVKDALYETLDDRFPFLEFNPDFYGPNLPNSIDILNGMTEKRLIKTHLPYFMLKEQLEKVNPKIVIVMRNPKDNVTSFFHFYRLIHNFGWDGQWTDMLKVYLKGKTFSGDFFTNNLEWWSLRERDNVMILRYEDLLRQPHQEIRNLASFLGYELSPEKRDIIAHNTSFTVMNKNENLNFTSKDGGQFIRKGVCGDWKSKFTVSQNEEFDRHIDKRLAGSGLCFYYE